MLDTEVEGVLIIDGRTVTLKKVLKEKWVKKRGEVDAELKGTETLYYMDDVPLKQSEYKQKISDIIDENIFKLITNPMYFSTSLKWQDRRKVLMDILGGIDDAQVINYKPELKPLEALLSNKDIDTLKKSISARRKKLNDDIKGIQPRVDELTRSIREDLNFDTLDFQRRSILASIKNIDEKLVDGSKVDESKLNDRKKFYELQAKLVEIEQKAKEEAQKPLQKLQDECQHITLQVITAKGKLAVAKSNAEAIKQEIERLKKLNNDLREQWKEQNTKTLEFNDEQFICPTCKRPFDESDVEAKKQEMQENFNLRKAENLKSINESGKANVDKIKKLQQQIVDTKIETLEAEVKALEEKAAELKHKVDSFKPVVDFSNNPEYKAIKIAIESLEAKLQQPSQISFEEGQLKLKKAELEKELNEVNSKLAYKDANERAKARIEELLQEEKDLAQQIADLQRQEDLCDTFTKAKVELLESSINSKFKYVTFKLFDLQVNGGLVECCEPMVNGVPFTTNLNSGARINAGLDIINALCTYYQVSAPIFIDNKETVTKTIPVKSQVINLIVSESDKALRVERV
jgi:hypothetical protein